MIIVMNVSFLAQAPFGGGKIIRKKRLRTMKPAQRRESR